MPEAPPAWQRWMTRVAHALEQRIDRARMRAGSPGARQVVAYRSFGNDHEIHLAGRVLTNPPAPPVDARDAWWRNLANAIRHLESDEVPGAILRLRCAGAERETLTDDEGFYRTWLAPAVPLGDALWHDADVEVLEPLHAGVERVRATARVLVPRAGAGYGVISDLDDTVIRTDATRLLLMLKRTLLENARTRLPFTGVARFYTGLHAGASGDAGNPIFYVSSSPWNLYPVLADFLAHQGLPAGPILLRDWGLSAGGSLPTAHGEHKLAAIRQIMDCYPRLPFILVGDSGQEDPEIYRDVVHEYRGRVLAVYIRDVTRTPVRSRAIGELMEEVRLAGSELLLSDDTLASARHAAERGWIGADVIADLAEEVSSSGARPG